MQATEKYLEALSRHQEHRRGNLRRHDVGHGRRHRQGAGEAAREGLEENTLIFFFSDNGGPTMVGTTINGSINFPLRGSKRTTLEGGIRVPFVVQWKGKLPAGKTYDQPIIQLDILPTALAAAGVEVKADWKLDGVNLLPFLEGKNAKRRTTCCTGASASKWPSARATGSWSATTRPGSTSTT